jgi:DNA-binding transcriptional ArsR family regulator
MSTQVMAFPPELRKALKALANEKRENIFLRLTEQGNSYTELMQMTNMRKGSLTHHLKTLMAAGLVRNFSAGRIQGPYDSFYATTGFGQSLVSGILEGIEPPRYHILFSGLTAAPMRDRYTTVARFELTGDLPNSPLGELAPTVSGAAAAPPLISQPLSVQR